jgi:hypothetical protein
MTDHPEHFRAIDGSSDRWRLHGFGRLQATVSLCGLSGVGLAGLGIALTSFDQRRFWLAYLVAFAFCLSLSLGSLFFLIVQHLCRSSWSVAVRRPAEVFAASVLIVALMFVPIGWSVASGRGDLYSWLAQAGGDAASAAHGANPTAHSGEAAAATLHAGLSPAKQWLLQPAFFLGRWIAFFTIWIGLSLFFWRTSVRQDRDGMPSRTIRMERWAATGALLFAVSVTWAAFDLLMSLNPHWQSTMFGVYFFAGSVVSSLSLLAIVTVWLRNRGELPSPVGTEHYLDLGRLMFGFVFFWGYIAFSQYMVLWYANIPLELTWLADRGATTTSGQSNGWTWLIVFLLFGHLLIPFAGLLSRHVKKRPALLATWGAWLLVMHYLDLAWIVLPEGGSNFRIGLIELGMGCALVSLFLWVALLLARPNALFPIGDPRLSASLGHESAY